MKLSAIKNSFGVYLGEPSSEQLNKGEARHALCRNIFYGRKGKLYQTYYDGMEEQLNALGLVTNAIIYWNSLYLEKVGMATLFLTKIIRWGESLGVMAPIALDNEPPRIGFFPAEACSFNYAASPEVSNPCSLSRVRFANLC